MYVGEATCEESLKQEEKTRMLREDKAIHLVHTQVPRTTSGTNIGCLNE